jgi:hypothetical protein
LSFYSLIADGVLNQYAKDLLRLSLTNGALSIQLQEISAKYIALDSRVIEFGIRAALASDTSNSRVNVNKASSIADITHAGADVSDNRVNVGRATSCIEETFALLQHSMTRGMRSGMLDLACAAVNVSNSILSSTTLNILENREINDDAKKILRERERQSQRNYQHQVMHGDMSIDLDHHAGPSSTANDIDSNSNLSVHVAEEMLKDTTSSVSTINNLYACNAYCLKLRSNMEDEGRADFDPSQYEKLSMVLEGLTMSAEQCQRASKNAINTLYKHLRHRLISRLDTMSGMSSTVKYLLNEDTYDQVKLLDPFHVEIVNGIHSILLPYSLTLCIDSFNILISKVMSTVTLEMYARACRRKFTHLGGIKFDSDVRKLLALFKSMTNRNSVETMKTSFSKLNCMAYILSMENISDVIESWNDGHILVLTVGDVKKIVQLRIDFDINDINSMVLR